MLRCDNT